MQPTSFEQIIFETDQVTVIYLLSLYPKYLAQFQGLKQNKNIESLWYELGEAILCLVNSLYTLVVTWTE